MKLETSRPLSRAFMLIDCFSIQKPELGVREAARMTGLSSSTAGRILAELRDLGVLNQNPDTRTYSLGGKVLAWSGVYTANLDIRNQALHALQELHLVTQETISLYVLEGSDRVCVERFESTQNVRIVARVGRRLPLYAGSGGKAILAFLSEERREAILTSKNMTPLTTKTLVDPHELRRELDKIRQQGYAVSYGEWLIDASGVGAPVFNADGEPIGAITISGPAQRFTEDVIQKYAVDIVRVARQLSRQMGFMPLNSNRGIIK